MKRNKMWSHCHAGLVLTHTNKGPLAVIRIRFKLADGLSCLSLMTLNDYIHNKNLICLVDM